MNLFSKILKVLILKQVIVYFIINIYSFLLGYYIEDEPVKICKDILTKIKDFFDKKILFNNIDFLIIINLLLELLNKKTKYLHIEQPYNKSLVHSLLKFGEPRGRNNDGNNIIYLQLGKQEEMLLDNNDIIKFQRIISLFILFIRF